MKALGTTRRARMAWRVLLYGGAVFVGLPLAFAHVMTRAYRPDAVSQPTRPWQQVTLTSEGLRLRAWIARGAPGKPAAVVVHGLGDTLESYREHARVLQDRGFTVILPDLRGHGGSEGSYTTLGGRERYDVRAAMDYLRAQGLARNGLLLMGHSMGAVAVLLAAVDQPDLRAVIVEAPYDTYRDSIAHHARILYGLPRWVPIIPLAIAAAEWRGGFDADEIDAVAAARRVHAPLFAIVDGTDDRMPEAVVRRVYDAHPGPKRLWVADGVYHVGAVFHADYRSQIVAFLEENGL
jgi:uncharacterized protein